MYGVGMRSRGGFGQLKQVVDGTNHRPLASDLVKPTQQELPETPGLLDLSEHGFDNLFAQPVAAAPAGTRASSPCRPCAILSAVVANRPHASGCGGLVRTR
jgi:hypothetical protein